MKSVSLKEQALAAELLVLTSENAMAAVSIPALWSMSLDLSVRPDRILLQPEEALMLLHLFSNS